MSNLALTFPEIRISEIRYNICLFYQNQSENMIEILRFSMI